MKKSFLKLRGVLRRDCTLAKYTSWKIGGRAEYFYSPVDLEDFREVIAAFKKGPITILGAATNVLIRDGGIKGLVVYLRDGLQGIEELDNGILRVEAGTSLTSLVKKGADLGMVDVAFMAGIPGTVGGALKMNAGAFGCSIWDYVRSVETIDRLGRVRVRSAAEFVCSYRDVKGLKKDEWFLAALLNFNRGEIDDAKNKIRYYLQQRANSQPLSLPSCGSVFRNPRGDYAARLIEMSGLKGRQIGGAKISEKHANFIVNCGGARAFDVENLMRDIVKVIARSSGVNLIPEVEVLGEK